MTATLCGATFSNSYVKWRKLCVMLRFVAVPDIHINVFWSSRTFLRSAKFDLIVTAFPNLLYIPLNLVGKESSEISAFLTVFLEINQAVYIEKSLPATHCCRLRYSVYCLQSKGIKRSISFLCNTAQRELNSEERSGHQTVKGTVSRAGLGFWWHKWINLGLNKCRAWFLYFFRCPFDILLRN